MIGREIALVLIVAFVCLFATIATTTHIVVSNSTARHVSCVENGGEYVRVAETTAMECVR
jgi:hypothetical protein